MALTTLNPREDTRQIIGFDTETAENGQKLVCISFHSLENRKSETYWKKDEAISYILSKPKSLFVATNLPYDLFALFSFEDLQKFRMLWAKGRMLSAKTWVKNSQQFPYREHNAQPIEFYDTVNFAPWGVEKWGKLLGIPKLETALKGKVPETPEQEIELSTYCERDAQISAEAMALVKSTCARYSLGLGMTLPSTAMKIFRTKFLKDNYWTPTKPEALWQFEGLYGGRTEAFARGSIENAYLYDVNSLYPHVMRNYQFPNPNFMRIKYNDEGVIFQYEGMSHVRIQIPKTNYPLLPVRGDKLYFPTGVIEGIWTHAEIREAISKGAVLLKANKSYYAKETCEPFVEWVDTLYNDRIAFQKAENPMEGVVKLLMNSLYGKFGQKFMGKENLIPCSSVTYNELMNSKKIERLGDFFIINQDIKPAAFCLPLWAAHITSYARMELQKHLELNNSMYCDTDSIVTMRRLPSSTALGKLKEECKILHGLIVKPKMYAFMTDNEDKPERVKCKGFGARIPFNVFTEDIIKGRKTAYQHVVKIKESLRRGLPMNAFMEIQKAFSCEDTKRKWKGTFSIDTLEYSEPWDFAALQSRNLCISKPQLEKESLKIPSLELSS